MSTRKAAVYTFGSNGLQFLIQFGSSVIVARLLTPDEMGVFAIAMAAYGLIFAFQNTGISQFIVNQDQLSNRHVGTAVVMGIVQSIAMAACLAALAYGVGYVLSDPRILPTVMILLGVVFLMPVDLIVSGLLQRAMRFDLLAVVNIFRALVSAGVTVTAAHTGFSYTSMAWGAVAGAIVAAFLGLCMCGRELITKPNTDHWKEYWRFGLSMISIVAITNLASRGSIIILGRLSSIADVGLFSRASGVAEMVQFGIIEPLGRLVLPVLVEHRRTFGAFGDAYSRASAVITVVSWPAFAGIALLARPLITLLYGPTWLPAAPALVWLCFARILIEAATCPVEVMIAAGRLHSFSRLSFVKSVVGLVAFSTGAMFGLTWAAAGRFVEAAFGAIYYLPHLIAVTGIRFRALLQVWFHSALAVVAATCPGFYWMIAAGWPDELPILELLGIIAAGVICWGAVLILLRHELWLQTKKGFSEWKLNMRVSS